VKDEGEKVAGVMTLDVKKGGSRGKKGELKKSEGGEALSSKKG